ncbi:hypothetical protein [Arthrobacter humicola]
MSEKNYKDRVLDSTAKDTKEIEDWTYGPGGKVPSAILVLLGI